MDQEKTQIIYQAIKNDDTSLLSKYVPSEIPSFMCLDLNGISDISLLQDKPPLISIAVYFGAKKCVASLIDTAYVKNVELVKYLIINNLCDFTNDADGNSPFHLAVRERNYDVVIAYCELLNHEIIEEKDGNGNTAIDIAKENNDSKMLSIIEQHSNEEHSTPQLFDAAANDDLNSVKKCIENGEDINQMSRQGYTALGYAIFHDRVDVVTYLLEKGAKTNIGSAIKIAMNRKNKQICDLLIKMIPKANINDFDENGLAFLDYAVSDPFNPDIFVSLIKQGAKLDQKNKHDSMSPFDILVEDRNIEAIDALSSNKIPLDVPNRYSFTHAAAALKDISFLARIIEKGGDVNFKFDNMTPLQVALSSPLSPQDEYSALEDIKLLLNPTSFEDLFSTALYLVEYGADMKRCFLQAIKDNDQVSIFFYLIAGCDQKSIMSKSSNLINQLIKFFTSNSTDSLARHFLVNNKLLILAARFSPPETLSFLIRKGYDIDCPDSNGMRPIHHAIDACKFANANVFIEYCASIQSPDFGIPSLLHCAASNESMMYVKCPTNQFNFAVVDKFVKYLIQNGECIDSSTIEGETPLSIAVDHKNYRFVEVLLRNSAKNDSFLAVKYVNNLVDEFPPEYSNPIKDDDLRIGSKFLSTMAPNNSFLAASCHHSSLTRLAALYFKKDVDLNTVINETKKQTILHIACERHLLSFIRFLVLNGADVNAIDVSNASSMSRAMVEGQTDIIEQLMTDKFDINAKDSVIH